MSEDLQRPQPDGPPSYANWLAAIQGEPSPTAYEFPLYTDAYNLTGQVTSGLGPYQFFNLVPPLTEPGVVRAAVIVRVEQHVNYNDPEMEKTDFGYYHGGTLTDEIAALASLLMGIRLRPGGESRRFTPEGDPRGKPFAYDYRPLPPLNLARDVRHRFVLPSATTEHSLMELESLSKYPKLASDVAIALVRVARLYQDALWLVESEPHLAWLMLVSAVETAANHWRTSKDEPLERLRASKPDLLEYLEGFGDGELPSRVAAFIHDSLGSTKKFVDFLLFHLPPPPEPRPAEWAQVSWKGKDLRRTFSKIYDYRSKALHSGIPFPAPMCQPPFHYKFDEWEADSEVPLGLASYSLGGIWLAKDIPILLHIFEYIARSALLTWWQSLEVSSTSRATSQ